LITQDSKSLSSDNNVITSVIARLEQMEKTVAPIQERLEALESELGEPVA